MMHGANKKQILQEAGDSYWSMPFDDFINLAKSSGFEVIYESDVVRKRRDGDTTDRFVVLWHDEGILLKTDSFSWNDGDIPTVNSADMYYNLKLHDEKNWAEALSSGHFVGEGCTILCGSHDVREGLIHTINKQRDLGKFLPLWVDDARCRLVHGEDYKQCKSEDNWQDRIRNIDDVSNERFAQLPQNVQDSIQCITKSRI